MYSTFGMACTGAFREAEHGFLTRNDLLFPMNRIASHSIGRLEYVYADNDNGG